MDLYIQNSLIILKHPKPSLINNIKLNHDEKQMLSRRKDIRYTQLHTSVDKFRHQGATLRARITSRHAKRRHSKP